MSTLQSRRGTDAQRLTITPLVGEFIWTTDTNKLYVGDGSTAGGIEVTDAENLPQLPSTETLYKLNVDSGGVGTWVENNIPTAPDNASTQTNYELQVPANSGDPVWSQATSGGSGVTVVTTSAQLLAAESKGNIVFIDANNIVATTALVAIIAQGNDTLTAGSSQHLRIDSIDTVNSTISVGIATAGNLVRFTPNDGWTPATNNTSSDGTEMFLGTTSSVDTTLTFQTTSSGSGDQGTSPYTINIVTGGSAGIVVNSTNFPVDRFLYKSSTSTLEQDKWYGFTGGVWELFGTT